MGTIKLMSLLASTSLWPILLLYVLVEVSGSNITCAIRSSVMTSSSSVHCMVSHLFSTFDWLTLAKRFCQLHPLYVWPHATHLPLLAISTRPTMLVATTTSTWVVVGLLPSYLFSWFWGILSGFCDYFCQQYIDIWNTATSEMSDILFWSCMIILIASEWFMLCYILSRKYPAKTITDTNYTDDIVILVNTPNQVETPLHSLEWAAAGIGLHVNAHKMEYMCYNQTGDISTLDGTSLKLVDKSTSLGSSVSSTRKRHRHAANEGMDSYR